MKGPGEGGPLYRGPGGPDMVSCTSQHASTLLLVTVTKHTLSFTKPIDYVISSIPTLLVFEPLEEGFSTSGSRLPWGSRDGSEGVTSEGDK